MTSRSGEELTGVLTELQEISRGIHPAILSQGGLAAALKTLVRRSATPAELSMQAQRQLPERVEVAAYYIIAEALANIAKHAHASAAYLDVDADATTLRFRADRCHRPRRGARRNHRDRKPPGQGTALHVTLPITAA